MKVRYSSNNSGGNWWLSDDNWRDLEAAGWEVEWYASSKDRFLKPDKDGRWLGTLASYATVEGKTLMEAVLEWERVTGLSSMWIADQKYGIPLVGSLNWESNYALQRRRAILDPNDYRTRPARQSSKRA